MLSKNSSSNKDSVSENTDFDPNKRFPEELIVDSELVSAADVAVEKVLEISKDEKVLIITNPNTDVALISIALYNSVVKAGGIPTLMVQAVKSQLDFTEPSVLNAIESEPEVLLSISHQKLGKDIKRIKEPIKIGEKKYDHYFHYLLGEKKARSFWSPSVTLEMFKKTVPIDYDRLRKRAARLKDILDKAESVQITTAAGTDLRIGLHGRETKCDDGEFSKPGSGGNLPCGEVFISPELGSSEGTIVFDGSISSHDGAILVKTPISARVKGGFVTEVSGDMEAEELNRTLSKAEETTRSFVAEGKLAESELDSYLKNIRHLGELGIGLNPKAEIVGNILEDEKVLKTCHIAIGSNYDEDANALVHLDGLIYYPTMTAELPGGEKVEFMTEGNFSSSIDD